MNEFVEFTYGTQDLIKNFSNYQIFLDADVMKNLELNAGGEVQQTLAKELLNYKGIDRTYTAHQMWQQQYVEGIPYILQNGYNQKRSGDILLVLAPGVISYSKTGSTHGSPQIYDTHVPFCYMVKAFIKEVHFNEPKLMILPPQP